MFYDGPTPPIGIFDEILKFEALMVYPGFGTRNFTDLIRSIDTEVFAVRNYYQPVPVRQYTPRLLQAITDLTLVSAKDMYCRPLILPKAVKFGTISVVFSKLTYISFSFSILSPYHYYPGLRSKWKRSQ